jgi:uncharacterized membrane protein
MSTVLLAVYDDYRTADDVRQLLVRDGFPTDRVDVTAPEEPGRAGYLPGDSLYSKWLQYFFVLLGREEDDEPRMLAERVQNGGAAIAVHPRGALETERATYLLEGTKPAHLVGHDLSNHGWEHAASRSDSAWLWTQHSTDGPDCIYCRLFPHMAMHHPEPGAAPSANIAAAASLPLPAAVPLGRVTVRRVAALQPLTWLREGWKDLWHARSASLAHGVLIAVLGAVLLALGSTHLYFIAAAVSGYLLIGPIMTTGACELSRRREAGERLGFDESILALTRNPRELIRFGVMLAAVAVVWFATSEITLRNVLHSSGPSLAEVIWGGSADTVTRAHVTAYMSVGAVFAGLVFALSVVAVPLIIDRRARAVDAMRASLKAAFWNPLAMIVWSALIVVLTAFGFATLLLGMVIVAPLLGHATWHAYRDLIE